MTHTCIDCGREVPIVAEAIGAVTVYTVDCACGAHVRLEVAQTTEGPRRLAGGD